MTPWSCVKSLALAIVALLILGACGLAHTHLLHAASVQRENTVVNWSGWQWGQYGIPAIPVVTGIQFGYGVSVGPHGGVYYASFNGRSISRFSNSGPPTAMLAGLQCSPAQVAVASTGNVYFTEQCGNIVEWVRQTASFRLLASGYSAASGIAVAPDGTVYFTQGSHLYAIKGGTVLPVAGGLNIAEGLAVGSNGDLYVGAYGNPNTANAAPASQRQSLSGRIVRVNPTTGQVKVLASGLWRVRNIALGPHGSVYFVEESNYDDQGNSGTLGKVLPTGQVETLMYDIDYPEGIAVAPDGSIYFTAERGQQVNAGTMLFRYEPGRAAASVADLSHGVTMVSLHGNVSATATRGTVAITQTAGTSPASVFLIVPRDLIDWSVNTNIPLPMPGSWSPLPKFVARSGGAALGIDVWMLRRHQGRRWPTQMVSGREVMAPGFSETPLAFIAYVEVPAGRSPVQVSWPAAAP